MELKVNMEQVKFNKRLMAYLLDILFVAVVFYLVSSIRFINPYYDKYIEVFNDYTETLDKYSKQEITSEEMLDMNQDNFYYLARYSISYNISTIVIIIGYYVLFQKFNNGQTLGKKIMKIKVVSKDNTNPSLLSYLLRSSFIYYLYVGSLIPLVLNSILSFTISSHYYLYISALISYLFFVISMASLVICMLKGNTIHDYLSKTKVVYEK